jgi:hypothetical protein
MPDTRDSLFLSKTIREGGIVEIFQARQVRGVKREPFTPHKTYRAFAHHKD